MRILVIGAGTYQVPAIERAMELGYEVFCVDGYAESPGLKVANGYKVIDVCDQEACLEYAKEIKADGVITYGATITLPTVAYIGQKIGSPVLSQYAAEISKNKYKIKSALKSNGLNVKGEFFPLYNKADASSKVFNYPCVVKPCDGSGSKGVKIVHHEREVDEALDYAFDAARNGEVYVESFIKGEEYSVEAYSYDGEVYIYSIVKTEFRYIERELYYGQCTYLGIDEKLEKEITEEIEKSIKALKITLGSVNFDIIVSEDDGKPYIIDVGIRVGQNLIASHLVPFSRGVNELDNAILASVGEKINVKPCRKRFVATKLLTYLPGRIKKIEPYKQLVGTNQIVDIILTKRKGDTLPPYKTKSDICGWVITTGNSPEEAQENATKARELLKDYIIIEREDN